MRRQTSRPHAPADQNTTTRPSAAAANESAQTVPVALGWDLVGGVLTVIATTPRRGSSCQDSWTVSPSIDLASITVGDASVASLGSRLSLAAVDASSLTPDTTYTFSYAIVMRTAASAWFGSRSVTVTVGHGGSVAQIPVGDGPARP